MTGRRINRKKVMSTNGLLLAHKRVFGSLHSFHEFNNMLHGLTVVVLTTLCLLTSIAVADTEWLWPATTDQNVDISLGGAYTLRWTYDHSPLTLRIFQGPADDGSYGYRTLLGMPYPPFLQGEDFV